MSIPTINSSMKRCFLLPLLVFIIFGTSTALAHNLYVLVTPNETGPDVVDGIFEHSPFPGKGTFLGEPYAGIMHGITVSLKWPLEG